MQLRYRQRVSSCYHEVMQAAAHLSANASASVAVSAGRNRQCAAGQCPAIYVETCNAMRYTLFELGHRQPVCTRSTIFFMRRAPGSTLLTSIIEHTEPEKENAHARALESVERVHSCMPTCILHVVHATL